MRRELQLLGRLIYLERLRHRLGIGTSNRHPTRGKPHYMNYEIIRPLEVLPNLVSLGSDVITCGSIRVSGACHMLERHRE